MRASELDPELRTVVDEIEAVGLPRWSDLSVSAARRLEDTVFSDDSGPTVADIMDVAFDGPHGEVPIRVYRPARAVQGVDSTPTLVYFHGGGWTLGTLDSIDGLCRRLAIRADAVVISVDYRLAPEHPFPTAVDEAMAATEWAAEVTPSFGGDPNRLGVAGTSAGGALAFAAVLGAQRVRWAGDRWSNPVISDRWRRLRDGILPPKRRRPVAHACGYALVLRAVPPKPSGRLQPVRGSAPGDRPGRVTADDRRHRRV